MSDKGILDGSNGWETVEVRKYLDNAIAQWRDKLIALPPNMENIEVLKALCYIDAFQSARISLLGGLCPRTPDLTDWLEKAK